MQPTPRQFESTGKDKSMPMQLMGAHLDRVKQNLLAARGLLSLTLRYGIRPPMVDAV